ncbi:hypothetical protein N1851_009259 [Merluccius polli]|uniref:THAP-type domain-containing protein n=1 Tax=Merluccius polli TaxID=89951 RepID=A0AA47P459_MERPO|nr:hypothetical protein N1851_009259 [Merluccius polli]
MATGKSHMKCCVVGCTQPHKSFHFLPTKENRRTAWLDFIFDGHVPATIGKKLAVCANHFTADCFENLGQYTAGFASTLRLTVVSVPTVHVNSADGDAAVQSLLFPATREIGCQTDPPEINTQTVGTQLSLRTLQPHFKSEGYCVQERLLCWHVHCSPHCPVAFPNINTSKGTWRRWRRRINLILRAAHQ